MKEYKNKQKENNTDKLPKLGFMIASAVLSFVLIIFIGVFCTSASKASDVSVDEVYTSPNNFWDDVTDEPEITTDEETTAEETTAEATETDLTAETETDHETGADTEQNGEDTEVTAAADETTAKETEPEATEIVPDPDKNQGADGKQTYREYNGRQFADNETFVGEYKTDRVSIGVSNVRDGDLSYYICDIKVKSVTDFRTAFANGSLTGRAYTSKIAASVGAGFAVNGDFCGFHSSGIIIRNGGLYRNKGADWDLCYLNRYGDLITCKNNSKEGKTLIDDGAWQSWCFGPALVNNYTPLTEGHFNTPGLSQSAREPRTAIGQIDELHYIILVVDAKRPSNGAGGWNTVGGMTFTQLARTFADLGCKTAYNLDGGASATMWLNGKVANEPAGNGERQVSDIIYFK